MGRTDPRLVDRLVDSDPALRRQGERDVVHEPEVVWAATRARRHRGLRCAAGGAPGPRGAAGGAFFPSDVIEAGPDVPQEPGQPWTATTWTLNALQE